MLLTNPERLRRRKKKNRRKVDIRKLYFVPYYDGTQRALRAIQPIQRSESITCSRVSRPFQRSRQTHTALELGPYRYVETRFVENTLRRQLFMNTGFMDTRFVDNVTFRGPMILRRIVDSVLYY